MCTVHDFTGLPGQFQCGNKRCEKQEGLKSWEVNFAYVEHGEKRNALVKLSKQKDKCIFPFSGGCSLQRAAFVHACMSACVCVCALTHGVCGFGLVGFPV